MNYCDKVTKGYCPVAKDYDLDLSVRITLPRVSRTMVRVFFLHARISPSDRNFPSSRISTNRVSEDVGVLLGLQTKRLVVVQTQIRFLCLEIRFTPDREIRNIISIPTQQRTQEFEFEFKSSGL